MFLVRAVCSPVHTYAIQPGISVVSSLLQCLINALRWICSIFSIGANKNLNNRDVRPALSTFHPISLGQLTPESLMVKYESLLPPGQKMPDLKFSSIFYASKPLLNGYRKMGILKLSNDALPQIAIMCAGNWHLDSALTERSIYNSKDFEAEGVLTDYSPIQGIQPHYGYIRFCPPARGDASRGYASKFLSTVDVQFIPELVKTYNSLLPDNCQPLTEQNAALTTFVSHYFQWLMDQKKISPKLIILKKLDSPPQIAISFCFPEIFTAAHNEKGALALKQCQIQAVQFPSHTNIPNCFGEDASGHDICGYIELLLDRGN